MFLQALLPSPYACLYYSFIFVSLIRVSVRGSITNVLVLFTFYPADIYLLKGSNGNGQHVKSLKIW